MTDDRFERELRGFLGDREPGAASPAFRARLQAVTAESPARPGQWLGRLRRAGVGLGAFAAVAVVVVAMLARIDGLPVREPDQVGQGEVPVAAVQAFVQAPSDLFTSGAVADAERRLAAVYRATGVEARLLVTLQAGATTLAAPPGWPAAFDSDGDPDRDLLAVIGVTPDGSPVCCLTLVGTFIEQARADGYWRPLAQPAALDADLAAATAEFRDVALDRFVRGIEDLAPGIAIITTETIRRDDYQRLAGLLAFFVPLLLLALVALRWRPTSRLAKPASADGGMDPIERAMASMPAPLAPATSAGMSTLDTASTTTLPLVAWRRDDGGAWMPDWAVRSDRTWILVSLAAIGGLALLGVVDLTLPARTDVRLDPTIDGVGVVRSGLSVLPLALVGIAAVALIAYAWQGRWRRRIGVVILAGLVAWTTWIAADGTRPALRETDRGWVASDGAVVDRQGASGLMERVSYALEPDQPFTFATTIRNEGFLPMTVLGLAGRTPAQPNPYVASIVSIGWVVQPPGDGPVRYLSADPDDASAIWPVTLGPGEELAIVLVGRGGECARSDGTTMSLGFGPIDVAYRVLGFDRTNDIGMPAMVSIPVKDPCTVEVPGGTITYGTPDQ